MVEFQLKIEKTVLQNLLKTLPINVLSTTPFKPIQSNLIKLNQKGSNSLFVKLKKNLNIAFIRINKFILQKFTLTKTKLQSFYTTAQVLYIHTHRYIYIKINIQGYT